MSSEISLFFTRVIKIGILTAGIVGALFFGIPVDPDHYFAGSLQQIELLEKTNGPRIILIGGSNVAFGFDAALMQQQLGIPVINDGLHAGLGIVPVRELQKYIREGDIIILSLEYSLFSSKDAMNGDPVFLADWIEYSPSRAGYLDDPITEILQIYAIMLQRKVNRTLEKSLRGGTLSDTRQIFNSENFDTNGDFVGHLQRPSEPPQKIPSDPFPVFPLQDDIFVFLDEFHRSTLAKGATVYFEAPASRKENCSTTGEAGIANFFTTFSERSSIPLLTSPDQICMPNGYFFDTPYHLNAEGREIKTRHLIEKLIEINPNITTK